jgi:hemolysin III
MADQSLTLTTPLPAGSDGPGGARIPPETANQWTHAGGFVLSLAAAGYLLPTACSSGDVLRILGCAVYALTLVGLYAASTLSHSFDDPVRRNYYRMLDQVCIFLLVVGTYTPFGLVYALDGGWWLVLAAMWTVALMGIVKRLRSGTESVPIAYFLVLGWLPVPVIWRIFEVGQLPGLGLVVAGGLAYSGGTWFLANDHRRPYYHAVWHLCTITGSALHFFYVLQYVATPAA